MTEKYMSTGRFKGDEHLWEIDLKWSAWSGDPGVWDERAPKTYAMLVDGFDGGFEESGETVRIRSGPRKESRYMEVVFKPEGDGVRVYARVTETWDSVEDLLVTLGLPDRCGDALQDYLFRYDMTVDGEPGIWEEKNFVAQDLDTAMKEIDLLEDHILQAGSEAFGELQNWAIKQKMEGCARDVFSSNPDMQKLKRKLMR